MFCTVRQVGTRTDTELREVELRDVWRTRLAVAIDGSGTAAGVCGLSVLVVQHHSAAALGAILSGRLAAVGAAWVWTTRAHRRGDVPVGGFARWVWAMVCSNFLLVVGAALGLGVPYLLVLYAVAASCNSVAGMQATGRGVNDIVAIGPAGGVGLAIGGVVVGACFHTFGSAGVMWSCAVLLFLQLVEVPLIGSKPLVVTTQSRKIPFEPVAIGLCLGLVALSPLALYYGVVTDTLGAAWVAPAAFTYALSGLLAPVVERRLHQRLRWTTLVLALVFLNALHVLLSGGGWFMLVDRASSGVVAFLIQGHVSRKLLERYELGGVYAFGLGISVGVAAGVAMYGAVVSSYGIASASAVMVCLSLLAGPPAMRLLARDK